MSLKRCGDRAPHGFVCQLEKNHVGGHYWLLGGDEEEEIGRKDDSGKPRWDLLPFDALDAVAKVLTQGAEKYGDDNWRLVDKWDKRYQAALLRHIRDWKCGVTVDPDSGAHPLAHVATNALFLLAKALEEKK